MESVEGECVVTVTENKRGARSRQMRISSKCGFLVLFGNSEEGANDILK